MSFGQPNVKLRRLDDPIEVPGALSFLAYGTFQSYVHGLDEYPEDAWPDNIELLYYAFHLMITLGTLFIAVMFCANIQRFRGRLESSTWLLWVLMLAFPFPYIANTLGWMTSGTGPAALACLRALSHPRRVQQTGRQWQRHLYANRLLRTLLRPRPSLFWLSWGERSHHGPDGAKASGLGSEPTV